MVYDVASENKRDVDITISYKNEKGEETSFVGLEVKDEKRPLDSTKVEQLCMKFKDMESLKRGGIVSASGYTKPAIKKADYHKIELYEFKDWELQQTPKTQFQSEFIFKEQLNEWVNTPHFTYYFYEELNENDLNIFCNESKVIINSDITLNDKIKIVSHLNNYLLSQASKMPEIKSQLENKNIEEETPINVNIHLPDNSIKVYLKNKQITVKMVNITGIIKKILKEQTKTAFKMLVKYSDENYRIGSAICELSNRTLVGFAISTTKENNSLNLIHIPIPERLKAKIYRQKIK